MINCPKCKREIYEESKFCPYCMTRFVDTKHYTINNKKRNYKMLVIIFSILMAMIIAGIFVFFITSTKTSDKNKENVDQNNSNDIKYDIYVGKYFNEECTDGTPEDSGGYELNIYAVQNNTAIFSLFSYQSPPASRFAYIENMTGEIKDGKIDFMFSDDGWNNSGTGSIVFLENNRIYVNIKLTSANSNAMWDINTDNYFKKVSKDDINDYIDFSNTLGEDISVIKSKLEMELVEQTNFNGYTYYFYPNIAVVENNNKVIEINVEYSGMEYEDKMKYNFTFGINGLTKYKYLTNKYSNIKKTVDNGNIHTTVLSVDDEKNIYMEVIYNGNELESIKYYMVE